MQNEKGSLNKGISLSYSRWDFKIFFPQVERDSLKSLPPPHHFWLRAENVIKIKVINYIKEVWLVGVCVCVNYWIPLHILLQWETNEQKAQQSVPGAGRVLKAPCAHFSLAPQQAFQNQPFPLSDLSHPGSHKPIMATMKIITDLPRQTLDGFSFLKIEKGEFCF